MVKYLHISSYIWKPFLIYDFATNSIGISLYEENLVFFYQFNRAKIRHTVHRTVHNSPCTSLIILAPRLGSPGVQWEHSRGRGRWRDQLTEAGFRPHTGRRARSWTLKKGGQVTLEESSLDKAFPLSVVKV